MIISSPSSPRYALETYPTGSPSRAGVNLIRQQSYISAVRSANQSEQPDFGKHFSRIDKPGRTSLCY
jgi:hypothetical protein